MAATLGSSTPIRYIPSWICRPLSAAKPVTRIRSTKRTIATGRILRDMTEKVFFTSQRAMVAMFLPALMAAPPENTVDNQ